MTKETRREKFEREYKEMQARVLARHAEGARHLPHNQPKS
jgi:hypothetical protein